LEPGVSWEEGFCDGLVKSRIFVPILSRNAINHPNRPNQNFSMLKADSKCDNVLLEHLLSLELQERGLIERIYPILIGDRTQGEEASEEEIENYFASGCNPVLDEKESVVVASVLEKCHHHLFRVGLGTPLLLDMTVAKVLSHVLVNQGLVVEGPLMLAFQAVPEAIRHMIELLDDMRARSFVGADIIEDHSSILSRAGTDLDNSSHGSFEESKI
jgi:hypothetical protein